MLVRAIFPTSVPKSNITPTATENSSPPVLAAFWAAPKCVKSTRNRMVWVALSITSVCEVWVCEVCCPGRLGSCTLIRLLAWGILETFVWDGQTSIIHAILHILVQMNHSGCRKSKWCCAVMQLKHYGIGWCIYKICCNELYNTVLYFCKVLPYKYFCTC